MSELRRITVYQPYTVTSQGRTAVAAWEMYARSRVVMERELARQGIVRRSVFADVDGSIPDITLRLDTISIDPINNEGLPDDRTLFQAVATFANVNNSSFNKGLELIVNGPAIWSSRGTLSTKPVDVDIHGRANINTAGVPIEGQTSPFPTEILIAEWVRNPVNWFDAQVRSRDFSGKVNSRTFRGVPPRCLLCHGLRPEALDNGAFAGGGMVKYTAQFELVPPQRVRGKAYVRAGFVGEFVEYKGQTVPGFTSQVLNVGTVQKNPRFRVGRSDPNEVSRYIPIYITDPQGKRVIAQQPVLLDKDGNGPTDRPITLLYENIEEADFNRIGIRN